MIRKMIKRLLKVKWKTSNLMPQKHPIDNVSSDSYAIHPEIVQVRCPHCGDSASFEGVGIRDYRYFPTSNILGVRRCPSPSCHGQLFVQKIGNNRTTYRAVLIDFDGNSIPDNISDVFGEALLCHSVGANVASAIMVRKTLELVCEDMDAKGSDLKERIKALEQNITLPKALFDAMDNLRLLGNDAAHVETKTFDSITEKELALAIGLAKEILKSTYQLDGLVSELRKLKKDE